MRTSPPPRADTHLRPHTPARRGSMTARRLIRRSALVALCIGVAPLCALRLRGIARRACPRLRRYARRGGYLTLRRLTEIPIKCPCLPVQPCQLAKISQKSRRGRHGRQTSTGHGPPWAVARPTPTADPSPFVTDFGIVSQMKAGGAVCDKIRECITTRERAQPPQTRDPAFLASKRRGIGRDRVGIG